MMRLKYRYDHIYFIYNCKVAIYIIEKFVFSIIDHFYQSQILNSVAKKSTITKLQYTRSHENKVVYTTV